MINNIFVSMCKNGLRISVALMCVIKTQITYATIPPAPLVIEGPYSQTVYDLDILYNNYTIPADHPTSPGDYYNPTVSAVTPVATAPRIADFTRQASIDRSVVLQGINFTRNTGVTECLDTKVWIWNQTTSGNGQLFQAKFLKKTPDTLTAITQAVTPLTLNYGLSMLWVENADGVSYPVRVNGTDAWWVGPTHALRGGEVSVYGRNLSRNNGTSESYVFIRPWGAGTGMLSTPCTVTSVNPYKVTFTIPSSIPTNADYEAWIHNGHGGQYGWSGPMKLTVDAAERYQWNGTVRTVAAPSGGDDTTAIQNVVNAATAVGDVVRLQAGTYHITSPIWIRRGISFEGAGKTTTIVQSLDSTYSSSSLIRYENMITAGPFRVQNMTLKTIPGNSIQYALLFFGGYGVDPIPTGVVISNVQVETFADSTHSGVLVAWANDVTITNCTGLGAGFGVSTSRYVTMRGNTIRGMASNGTNQTGAAFGVSNSQYVDFSGNYAESYDRANKLWLRRMYTVGSPYWPNINQYIGNNQSAECGPYYGNSASNSGENILLEHGGTTSTCKAYPASVTATAMTFSGVSWTANAWVTDDLPGWSTQYSASVALITRGPGMGQWRRIVANGSNTLTVDRPWDVQPDTSSLILIDKGFYRCAIYGNTLQGPLDDNNNGIPDYQETNTATVGVETYGTGSDIVISGNSISRMRYGIFCSGMSYGLKNPTLCNYRPEDGILIANNTIANCNWGIKYQASLVPDSGQTNDGDTLVGPVMQNFVARDNTISSVLVSGICLDRNEYYPWTNWPWVIQNSVLEWNAVMDAPKCVELADLHVDSILYKNSLASTSYNASAVGTSIDFDSEGHILMGNYISANLGKLLDTVGDSEKLYGHWKMDEASWNGTQEEVWDSSKMGAHGRCYVYGGNTVTGGISGRAGSFDGVNDAVIVNDMNCLDIRDDMTVSAWVKTSTVKADQVIIQKFKTTTPSKGWCFRLSGNNLIFFTDNYASAVTANVAGCLNGAWHHVAAVKQIGQPMSLYVDGYPVASYLRRDNGAAAGSAMDFAPSISWASSSWCFNGNLDEIRVYGRALSSAEILNLFNNP